MKLEAFCRKLHICSIYLFILSAFIVLILEIFTKKQYHTIVIGNYKIEFPSEIEIKNVEYVNKSEYRFIDGSKRDVATARCGEFIMNPYLYEAVDLNIEHRHIGSKTLTHTITYSQHSYERNMSIEHISRIMMSPSNWSEGYDASEVCEIQTSPTNRHIFPEDDILYYIFGRISVE